MAINCEAERERMAHERRLATRTRPQTEAEQLAIVKSALRQPLGIEQVLKRTGSLDILTPVASERSRREHDFRRSEDRDEAIDLIKAARSRPISVDALLRGDRSGAAPTPAPRAAVPAAPAAPTRPATASAAELARLRETVNGSRNKAASGEPWDYARLHDNKLEKRIPAPPLRRISIADKAALNAAAAVDAHLIFDGSGSVTVAR